MLAASYRIKADDRILYIRLSAIGDVVNAIPGLVALRRSYPNNFIAWCVEELSADLLRGHPYIDELLVIPARWRKHPLAPGNILAMQRFIRYLRDLRFTVAIDAGQNLLKSGLVAWLSGAPLRAAIDWKIINETHRIFFNCLLRHDHRPGPAALVRATPLASLGVDVSKAEYILPPLQTQRIQIEELLREAGIFPEDLSIVLNPCTSRPNKQWPGDRFVKLGTELATKFNAKIIWIGSASERNFIASLAAGVPVSTLNLAGRLSLTQLAALFYETKLLVTGDTGPAHIGAAAGIFMAVLMGSTDPRIHSPFTERKVVFTAGLACQYCGKRRCVGDKTNECMKRLDQAEILAGVEALIRARVWETSRQP